VSLTVGDTAPEFTLPDTEGNQVTLSSLRSNGPVTIVFIPFAFSGICEGELCELRDNLEMFNNASTTVVAITCDRTQTNTAWKEQQGFNFAVLSDGWPLGEVASAYGSFNEAVGCADRRTVVVDAEGIVTALFESGGLGEARQLSSYVEALA